MTTEPFADTITLPDGTAVRGRGRRQGLPAGPLPDYGLYLGHSPDAPHRPLLRLEKVWRPGWAADWITWPDFRTPRDATAAAALIEHAHERARAGDRVEIACYGGTGRTGTVIACLAVLAGHPAAGAVEWTRRHYRPKAVETRGQRRWVEWFAGYRAAAVSSR
ncbi:protein-tyrosine phosphatase family protein [Amycolatopsis suaedae]|uniref:Phosphatase n=1 Tax=Amycolatopsis suaedae TaxID=2510978 RepID=A0A4V2EL51_9PSEU|nr:protein-tyrosine phosphatase family protein [Amycolatopsis suaedae]RZQ60345.1 phosphatase [Amycolatopsis suaedae]